MLIDKAHQPTAAFEQATGWAIKPEGACKGSVCIPLKDAERLTAAAEIDVLGVAEVIGLPVVKADGHELWAIGPEAIGHRTLVSAEAADFTLPDLDGNTISLSSQRGKKIVVYAWAPY